MEASSKVDAPRFTTDRGGGRPALSAAEVISRAKLKGIKLSAAQVYTIRANARRKDRLFRRQI